jgi:hypothetical protein
MVFGTTTITLGGNPFYTATVAVFTARCYADEALGRHSVIR